MGGVGVGVGGGWGAHDDLSVSWLTSSALFVWLRLRFMRKFMQAHASIGFR